MTASKAMSPRLFDTIGGAMGGERGNTGREAIRENHDDGEFCKASKRRNERRGDEPHARRHEKQDTRREWRHNETPNGTRSGTRSEPTKQAEANRTEYGMNAQGAGETIRMSSHDVILYCKD